MIPVHFISGYLGSGKTTMINCLLSQIKGKRIALILNDFGDICIDSSLVLADSDMIRMELSGGQIFCPCQSGNFIKDIGAAAAENPDMILVEPSGLVKPAALLSMIERMSASSCNVAFGSYTCVVDPLTFPVLLHTVNAIAEQAGVANRFVMNKTDLVTLDAVSQLRKLLQSVNPEAEVLETRNGAVSWNWFDQGFPPVDLGSERIQSFATWGATGRPKPFTVFPRDTITSMELEKFLCDVAADCLRAKGYVATSDEGVVLAQIASGRASVQKWDKPFGRTGLTIIQLVSHQAEYEEMLK